MELSTASKILEISLTQDIELDKETVKKIKAAKKVWALYYKANPQQFIEDYILILDGTTNDEIPFILNPAQKSLIDAMQNSRFVAAPKARQLGITTLTNALALHHSLFANNANVICMAMKNENAQENLRRIKTMFKKTPEWVQTLTLEFDDKIHLNNQGMWSFKSKLTQTDNKLEVASASSEDATRGKTPTFLHWTETHFSELADKIFTSVFPALNRRQDSVIVLESTGNGNSGFYYEVCTGRKKGFDVVFMPWDLDPGYTLPGDKLEESDYEYLKNLLGVEEIPEHLTDGQLRWYQATSETIGKAKCQQEYPINVEQVFQATNSSFFAYKTVQKLKGKPPLRTLAFEQGYLSVRAGGKGEVYEEISNDYEYLIAVDGSEGVIDPSAITILNPLGEEVLYWNERLIPDDLIKLLDVLGKQYNNASILIESNGIGQHFIRTLMTSYLYPNIAYIDGKPGLRVGVNKADIFATLQNSILEGKLTFNNQLLAQEMPRVDAEKLKSPRGEGIHDDTVDACAIAAYGFRLSPPKKRMVQDEFNDYSDVVYGGRQRPSRQFISKRRAR